MTTPNFTPSTLEDGEVAALLVEGQVGEALAVGAQQVPLVTHQGRVVQVLAAPLVEADDEGGLEAAGTVEHLEHLGRVGREGVPAGQLLGVGVAGQEALGETDDVDPLALGPLQTLDQLG
jgi:hypothetical protein